MARRRKGRLADPSLHKRWRLALTDAEMTETEWADARGFTQSHVHQVVKGDRRAELLLDEIERWIEERERMIGARLGGAALSA